jgi:hypothetical protein
MSFSGNQYPNNAAKVITTRGDIVRGNSSGERERYGIGAANFVLSSDGSDPVWSDPENLKHAVALEIACSDETTALTVSNSVVTFRIPAAMTLNAGNAGIRASLTGAGSSSGVTTIDVNQNGATILSTKLTIDYGEWTSLDAATPPVILTTALTDDSQITVDVDGLTGGANETGLKIILIGDLT